MSSVASLHIYPIKSLGSIALSEMEALTEGFKYDRRWMLVDESGEFLTQRKHKRMAQFNCEISDGFITVSYGNEQINIPLDHHLPDPMKVQVWSSKLKANEVSRQFSEWFSKHLGQRCTLVKMTDDSKRYKRLFTSPFKTHVSLADGYPYLVLGTASMKLLNDKCPETIPLDRFRANIILDTDEPHEEDAYSEFSLGTAKFKVIKPCARCQVITIDQQTGEMGKEPTKTLASYRNKKSKILFGANTILLEEGRVSIGDVIKASE